MCLARVRVWLCCAYAWRVCGSLYHLHLQSRAHTNQQSPPTNHQTQAASQRWDRLALAAALGAGQCTRADIEALAAASTEEMNGDGSGGERAAMAREYARRMRAAAEVVLKGLDQAG